MVQTFNIYHPLMRVGNVFSRVCLSVCQSVCLSMCLCVRAITFEALYTGTSFLVWRYILTISRSSLNIKVIGSRSRSYAKKYYYLFTYFNLLFLCMWLQVINKVKVTHQGQGQINIELKSRSFLRRDGSYVGGWHLKQMSSCFTLRSV